MNGINSMNESNVIHVPTIESTSQLVIEEINVTENKVDCSTRCAKWFRKFFMEGQVLDKEHTDAIKTLPHDASWYRTALVKYRRFVGPAISATVVYFLWLAYMIKWNMWYLFVERYEMSVTMVFGSLIAGMTSVGGGVVAFPVMTLVVNVTPNIARDFSLMVQFCGMTSASFVIYFMGIQVDWNSIIICSIGGVFGAIFGFEVVDQHLSPPRKKFTFTAFCFAFAFALFLLNRYRNRKTFLTVPYLNTWKGFVLFLTALVGGIFTALVGSGLDIVSFSVMTLLFRVTEKTATPTSVILMGINTAFATYWRSVIQYNASTDAFHYLLVCIPIVVIGAPMGSVIGSYLHRLVLASFVYIITTAALIGSFVVIRPLTPDLIGLAVGIVVGGGLIFFLLTLAGAKLLKQVEQIEEGKITMVDNGSVQSGVRTQKVFTVADNADPSVKNEHLNKGFQEKYYIDRTKCRNV
ncbi:unnamed protein product [Owenia fusiformis]|uniref:Uncharacterized protein n=1 Tax=Owenia fusiformis TaxID=6347 RepID=A0A8J1UW31_OWEFU|nr:unnamed protein product [Owenia fusiformis]